MRLWQSETCQGQLDPNLWLNEVANQFCAPFHLSNQSNQHITSDAWLHTESIHNSIVILGILLSVNSKLELKQNLFVDHFYVALFSTLEQTHCVLVACDSKWVTVAFYSAFRISIQVVYLQHCLVVTWLVPHETAVVSALSVYTIQTCTMSSHFMQSHIVLCRVHAFLAAVLAEWLGSFTCYCGNCRHKAKDITAPIT